MMLGTMWWAPEGDKGRILTRSLALDLNILWLKKSHWPSNPIRIRIPTPTPTPIRIPMPGAR